MGMFRTRELSKQQRQLAGVELDGKGSRPEICGPVPGYFWIDLVGDPPTVTHHAKEIKKRFAAGGTSHLTLMDSPALRAARDWYLMHIPERRELIPLRPPVVLHLTFLFASHEEPDGDYFEKKPDCSNLAKLLEDVLAFRGYLVNDSHVAKLFVTKRWIRDGVGRVRMYARTLANANDYGHQDHGLDGSQFEVHPAMWLADHDARAAAAAAASAQRVAQIAATTPAKTAIKTTRASGARATRVTMPRLGHRPAGRKERNRS